MPLWLQVQEAADELRRMTTPAASPAAARREVRQVQIEPKSFDVADYLWATSTTAVSLAADDVVIGFLALYLLVAGDLFRRRWLWGLPGLLRAVPLMMILKAVAEHIEAFEPVVALLRIRSVS